ncbi:hypothetical protein CMI40_00810 [Candidatus Pacearchaeota archaeon]|jgi:hypothetical protein|nr:hypothetical protein [Candidatus Pacearchaeota archaeon]|tara:strand:- start:11160 stop:11741 length:582 start_codon:yes stop_codon:yes gene_type:complete
MKGTLYYKLMDVEKAHNKYHKKLHNLNGKGIEILKSTQKEIINNHKNSISKQSIDTSLYRPFEKNLLELKKNSNGVWKYLPRRKNSEFNKEVRKLKDLIPSANYLERKGIFKMDNFLNGAAFGGLISLGTFAGLAYLFDNDIMETISQTWLFSTSFSLCGGLMAQRKRKDNNEKIVESIKEARYLDKKIKELF